MIPGWNSVHSRGVVTLVEAIVAAASAARSEGSFGPAGSDGGSDRIDGDGHRGHTDMYHRVARNTDVLIIHQLDGAAKRAGRGMRPQCGVVDRVSQFFRMAARAVVSARSRSVGRAERMFPGWEGQRTQQRR